MGAGPEVEGCKWQNSTEVICLETPEIFVILPGGSLLGGKEVTKSILSPAVLGTHVYLFRVIFVYSYCVHCSTRMGRSMEKDLGSRKKVNRIEVP